MTEHEKFLEGQKRERERISQTDQRKKDVFDPSAPINFGISGSEQAQMGGLEGLELGRMLYGQTMPEVGQEAANYSQMIKGRLGQDYARADLYRQDANRRLAQGANKLGMAGATLGGAQEQLYRQSSMQAEAMNQDYKDKAMAVYGKNIGAKQSGMSSLYFGGKGEGQAGTPAPVVSSGGGSSIICTELYTQGKISKQDYLKATVFGYSINPNTYFGYLTIATPIVKLMKKSDKFSDLFVGWAKSIAKQKPNTIARLLMPICFMVGYAKSIKKEKATKFINKIFWK